MLQELSNGRGSRTAGELAATAKVSGVTEGRDVINQFAAYFLSRTRIFLKTERHWRETAMMLGFIGCAGAGKTTLFEALTRSRLDTSQRKESRICNIQVPDDRVDRLSEMYRPRKTTFARVEYLLPAPTQHGKEKAREQSAWNGWGWIGKGERHPTRTRLNSSNSVRNT